MKLCLTSVYRTYDDARSKSVINTHEDAYIYVYRFYSEKLRSNKIDFKLNETNCDELSVSFYRSRAHKIFMKSILAMTTPNHQWIYVEVLT